MTTPKRRKYTSQEIHGIFDRFCEANPNPKGELNYKNAFTLLVAVVLSAQATDVGVNKATKALFAKADSAKKMMDLGEERIREYVKTIGLYRTKAKNVYMLSKILVEKYAGKVPSERNDLEELPGVGRKTANVVLNIYFGQPTIAVDTHIFRLSNRMGLAPGKTPLEVEKSLARTIPQKFIKHSHHWLILHGRYVCKARKPMCDKCLINDLCKSSENWAANVRNKS